MSPSARSLAARAAIHSRWGNTPDRTAATAAARSAFADRFLQAVRNEFPGLSDAAARKMAASRLRAHMATIAAKSVAARRARRARAAA